MSALIPLIALEIRLKDHNQVKVCYRGRSGSIWIKDGGERLPVYLLPEDHIGGGGPIQHTSSRFRS